MRERRDSWPHQVEIEVSPPSIVKRLLAIESWLAEWQIPYRIGSSLGVIGRMRICFAEERFLRAFRHYHGGRIVSVNEVDEALTADADDDALFDRLAGEYPE